MLQYLEKYFSNILKIAFALTKKQFENTCPQMILLKSFNLDRSSY